jgi:hypothetical protein
MPPSTRLPRCLPAASQQLVEVCVPVLGLALERACGLAHERLDLRDELLRGVDLLDIPVRPNHPIDEISAPNGVSVDHRFGRGLRPIDSGLSRIDRETVHLLIMDHEP